jgi:putative DNA primase/helicase
MLYMIKITSGSYRPGFTHPDWTKTLEALPKLERKLLQVRVGQGITGHTTPMASCRFSRALGRMASPR